MNEGRQWKSIWAAMELPGGGGTETASQHAGASWDQRDHGQHASTLKIGEISSHQVGMNSFQSTLYPDLKYEAPSKGNFSLCNQSRRLSVTSSASDLKYILFECAAVSENMLDFKSGTYAISSILHLTSSLSLEYLKYCTSSHY